MSLTRFDEREMIYDWAKENTSQLLRKEFLPQKDDNMSTYWEKHSDDSDICEYDFLTLRDFQEMLATNLKEEYFRELILPIAVAAFKEHDELENRNDGQNISNNGEFTIPDFIYVF